MTESRHELAEGSGAGIDPNDPLSRWEARWRDALYKPPWRRARIARELRVAVADGWFRSGSRLLDVGCGDGWNAIRLARFGFLVTGIDFAHAAIDRAEAQAAGEARRPTFLRRDIRRESVGSTRFRSLLDVGCFHELTLEDARRYGRNLASAAEPEARYLLIAPLLRPGGETHDPRERAAEILSRVERALVPWFTIAAVCLPDRTEFDPGEGNLRLEVRLTRRAA